MDIKELHSLVPNMVLKPNQVLTKEFLILTYMDTFQEKQYRALGIILVLYKSSGEKFGFLRYRENNFQQSLADVYLTSKIIDRYNLRNGQQLDIEIGVYNFYKVVPKNIIECVTNSDKSYSLKDRITIFPNREIDYNTDSLTKAELITINLIRCFCPQGYGQRTMILAPATAGKTTLLVSIGKSIKLTENTVIAVLLIEERPEEVQKVKDLLPNAIVFAATFDEEIRRQVETVELFINYVNSQLLMGKDVICLVDSMTRIARAYNVHLSGTGKTMTGGLDPVCLEKVKRLFGLARCYVNKEGSCTMFGTCLHDTSSTADDIISRELRSASNSEIVISLNLSRAGIYPAIDVEKSLTRNFGEMMTEDKFEKLLNIRQNFLELYDNNIYSAYRILHNKIAVCKNMLDLICTLSVIH